MFEYGAIKHFKWIYCQQQNYILFNIINNLQEQQDREYPSLKINKYPVFHP